VVRMASTPSRKLVCNLLAKERYSQALAVFPGSVAEQAATLRIADQIWGGAQLPFARFPRPSTPSHRTHLKTVIIGPECISVGPIATSVDRVANIVASDTGIQGYSRPGHSGIRFYKVLTPSQRLTAPEGLELSD
jgi:hypothetical protein